MLVDILLRKGKEQQYYCVLCLFYSGCGAKIEETQFSISDEQPQSVENLQTEDANGIEEKNETECIQDEIAKVGVKFCKYEIPIRPAWDNRKSISLTPNSMEQIK